MCFVGFVWVPPWTKVRQPEKTIIQTGMFLRDELPEVPQNMILAFLRLGGYGRGGKKQVWRTKFFTVLPKLAECCQLMGLIYLWQNDRIGRTP